MSAGLTPGQAQALAVKLHRRHDAVTEALDRLEDLTKTIWPTGRIHDGLEREAARRELIRARARIATYKALAEVRIDERTRTQAMSRHHYTFNVNVNDDQLADWQAERLLELGDDPKPADIALHVPGEPDAWNTIGDLEEALEAGAIETIELLRHVDADVRDAETRRALEELEAASTAGRLDELSVAWSRFRALGLRGLPDGFGYVLAIVAILLAGVALLLEVAG